VISESLRFAYDNLSHQQGAISPDCAGHDDWDASLVLVGHDRATGKQYILDQIQGIGANLIYASLLRRRAAHHRAVALDELTVDDLTAVREQVPSVVAASPFVTLNDRISVGNGKEQDILILGVVPGIPSGAEPVAAGGPVL